MKIGGTKKCLAGIFSGIKVIRNSKFKEAHEMAQHGALISCVLFQLESKQNSNRIGLEIQRLWL